MARRQVFALLALIAACGGDGGPTDPGNPPPPPHVEGIWTFFETLSDAGQSVRCDDQGRFDLTRTTIRVSGEGAQQGRCTEPNGSVDNSGIDLLFPWKPIRSAGKPAARATANSPPVQTSRKSPSS